MAFASWGCAILCLGVSTFAYRQDITVKTKVMPQGAAHLLEGEGGEKDQADGMNQSMDPMLVTSKKKNVPEPLSECRDLIPEKQCRFKLKEIADKFQRGKDNMKTLWQKFVEPVLLNKNGPIKMEEDLRSGLESIKQIGILMETLNQDVGGKIRTCNPVGALQALTRIWPWMKAAGLPFFQQFEFLLESEAWKVSLNDDVLTAWYSRKENNLRFPEANRIMTGAANSMLIEIVQRLAHFMLMIRDLPELCKIDGEETDVTNNAKRALAAITTTNDEINEAKRTYEKMHLLAELKSKFKYAVWKNGHEKRKENIIIANRELLTMGETIAMKSEGKSKKRKMYVCSDGMFFDNAPESNHAKVAYLRWIPFTDVVRAVIHIGQGMLVEGLSIITDYAFIAVNKGSELVKIVSKLLPREKIKKKMVRSRSSRHPTKGRKAKLATSLR